MQGSNSLQIEQQLYCDTALLPQTQKMNSIAVCAMQ
jgi:hypothetical protein